MPRQLLDGGSLVRPITKVVPIEQGGTNATTPQEAIANLQGIDRVEIDQPLGVAGTDFDGYLKRKYLEAAGIFSGVTLEGPTKLVKSTLFRESKVCFFISNYDSLSIPEISFDNLLVQESLEIFPPFFKFTVPFDGDVIDMRINERIYALPMVDDVPLKPVLLFQDGQRFAKPSHLQCSMFKTLGTNDLSANGAWVEVTANQVDVQVGGNVQGILLEGWSGPSGKLTVDTGEDFIVFPKSQGRITISPDQAGRIRINRQNSSDVRYLLIENTMSHQSTEWQVSTDPEFNAIVVANTTSTEKYDYPVNLPDGTYYARCRHTGSTRSAWSDTKSFTVDSELNSLNEYAVIVDANRSPGAGFGSSVSTNRYGTVLVGAPNSNVTGNNCGSVALFKQDGHLHHYLNRISAPYNMPNEQFGMAVQITDQDEVFIGNPGFSSVWIYQLQQNNFSHQRQITPVTPSKGFGFSVKVTDRLMFVGAPMDDVNGVDAGAVHVYERDGDLWTHKSVIYPTTPGAGEFFGVSVESTQNGDLLFIGACNPNPNNANSKLYIFQKNETDGYTEIAIRNSPMPVVGNQFARSLSFQEATRKLYVGCAMDSQQQPNGGMVFEFYVSADPTPVISYVKMISPTNGTPLGYFGTSISIAPVQIRTYIGAPGYVLDATDIGGVYYFT